MTTTSWPAWGTTVSVTALDPGVQRAAVRLVHDCLATAEKAAYPGHPGSQVHRLLRRGGRLRRPSSLLAGLVAASVEGSRYSGGLLDATVGNTTWRLSHGPRPTSGIGAGCGGGTATSPRPAPGFDRIRFDAHGLAVPTGLLLDLSATAKAVLATAAATFAAERLGTGVLVDLGGDVAADGPVPRGGWPTLVGTADGDGGPDQVMLPPAAALATSRGTHAVDPRTGLAAPRHWASVSVLDGDLVLAKSLALAAHVVGPQAPDWLTGYRVPVRLERLDGAVVRLGGWPAGASAPTRPVPRLRVPHAA